MLIYLQNQWINKSEHSFQHHLHMCNVIVVKFAHKSQACYHGHALGAAFIYLRLRILGECGVWRHGAANHPHIVLLHKPRAIEQVVARPGARFGIRIVGPEYEEVGGIRRIIRVQCGHRLPPNFNRAQAFVGIGTINNPNLWEAHVALGRQRWPIYTEDRVATGVRLRSVR